MLGLAKNEKRTIHRVDSALYLRRRGTLNQLHSFRPFRIACYGLGISSLLPTATQRLIKLNKRREFVALRLGQPKFSGERVGIVGQDFNIVRGPYLEAHF